MGSCIPSRAPQQAGVRLSLEATNPGLYPHTRGHKPRGAQWEGGKEEERGEVGAQRQQHKEKREKRRDTHPTQSTKQGRKVPASPKFPSQEHALVVRSGSRGMVFEPPPSGGT